VEGAFSLSRDLIDLPTDAMQVVQPASKVGIYSTDETKAAVDQKRTDRQTPKNKIKIKNKK
jgi:hypothetical protein